MLAEPGSNPSDTPPRRPSPLRERTAHILMEIILEQVVESGATHPQAKAAIEAALAMLQDLELPTSRYDS
jgi:hypothetical protein